MNIKNWEKVGRLHQTMQEMGFKYLLIIQHHMKRSSMTLKWRDLEANIIMCCDSPWGFKQCLFFFLFFFYFFLPNSYNIIIKIVLHFNANNISRTNTIRDQPKHTHSTCTFLLFLTYNRKSEYSILNNCKTWLMVGILISTMYISLNFALKKCIYFFNCIPLDCFNIQNESCKRQKHKMWIMWLTFFLIWSVKTFFPYSRDKPWSNTTRKFNI